MLSLNRLCALLCSGPHHVLSELLNSPLSDVEYSITCNGGLNIHVIFRWKGAHTFGLQAHADGGRKARYSLCVEITEVKGILGKTWFFYIWYLFIAKYLAYDMFIALYG